MKKFFSIVFIIGCVSAQSQSLEQNIPLNSAMVFEINTPEIVKAIPYTDLEKSSYGKDVIKELSKLVDQDITSFEDLGIMTTTSSYIFSDQNDSQLVLVYLLPIKDAGTIENILVSKELEIKDAGTHKYAFSSRQRSYHSSSYYDEAVEETYAVEEEVVYEEEVYEEGEMYEVEEEVNEPQVEEAEYPVEQNEAYAVEPEYEVEPDYEYDHYGYDDYQEPRNEQVTMFSWNANTLSIVVSFKGSAEMQTSQNYLSPSSAPITGHTSYLKQQDPEAALSFWVGDISNSISEVMKFMGELNKEFSNTMISSTYMGYQAASLKLYLEPTETKLTSEFTFSDELGKTYKKVSKQKMNPKFFKYVDLENCMAYFSSNMNVENLLLEYPTILGNQISALQNETPYMDEVDLGMSLFFTLLDEEAVGEIIRGDILFVFSDFANKEVEYTDYEYDSNYTAIPVTKTKIEKVPDFIVMASTKEGDLTNKTISYLEKKKFIQREGDFFKVAAAGMIPYEIYFMIKNDIVFIGTSRSQFSAISSNSYDANVPGNFKKHIKKNQTTFYADITKAESYLDEKEFNNKEKYAQVKELVQNSPQIIATGEKFKKNKAKGSIVINTADGYASGISYLLYVLEKLN